MKDDNVDFSVKRLEHIKQETILKYLETVDLDSIMGFYDSMVDHVFNGDLDHEFLSKSLMGLDTEEKSEIFQLARRYKGLCFLMGDSAYWADSIDGVTLSDVDLVCMKLFDNYDFLLGLAKDGGEQTLKSFNAFNKGSFSTSGSVIDSLRTIFGDDDTLKDILIEMSKEDGKYQGLTNRQKEILCTYPEGVLFDRKKDKIQILPREEIIKRIQNVYFGTESEEFNTFEKLGKLFADDDEFESMVVDVYYSGQDDYGDFSK
jgi:hypothetical protein